MTDLEATLKNIRETGIVNINDIKILDKSGIPSSTILFADGLHIDSLLKQVEDFLCLKKDKDKIISLFSYSSEIYPVKMWVSFGMSIESLKNIFDMDDDELGENDMGAVSPVQHKKEKRGGYLVRFKNVNEISVLEISHEASHVAMMIYEYIGASVDLYNQEPFAYLVSWAANNITNAKMKYEQGTKNG